MSGVKRYMHISPLCEAAPLLMANYPMATEYVLASDYDACASRLHEVAEVCAIAEQERDTFKAECVNLNNILDQIRTERDELRAQVEVMRALLRKVAPHFAAPPGLGYLYQEIDAALQEPGEEK